MQSNMAVLGMVVLLVLWALGQNQRKGSRSKSGIHRLLDADEKAQRSLDAHVLDTARREDDGW